MGLEWASVGQTCLFAYEGRREAADCGCLTHFNHRDETW